MQSHKPEGTTLLHTAPGMLHQLVEYTTHLVSKSSLRLDPADKEISMVGLGSAETTCTIDTLM
jgi:hypothetical protein